MKAKNNARPADSVIQNSGHLCSIYCPNCGKVTDKISFNLLRESKRVEVTCRCSLVTILEFDGERTTICHC